MIVPRTGQRAVPRDGHRVHHFGDLSLRWRILLSQLPLTVSAVLVTLAVLLIDPHLATGSPHLLGGLAGILALTVAAAAVPWQRFPPIAYWVIPLADFVAIAPFWAAARYALDGMSMLVAFPVFWLAWSGIRPVLGITLGVLGSAAVTWWPYLTGGAPFPDATADSNLGRPVIVPVLTLALAIAASVLTRSMDRQSGELQASLDYAATQNRMLHTVVETSEVGILVVDRDGHDVLMNQAQRRMHFIGVPSGMDDGAEADLHLFESDGTTPVPPAERPVRRALQGESFCGEIYAIGIDGSQQHMSVSAAPMVDERGEFDGTVVIFQNVTDLIGAIRAREQFVAEVTHEFRTPLTSIIGYLDLALEAEHDPAVGRYLTTSVRNAERLLTLVTNLLDARASTSAITVQDVDLARLARYSLDSAAVHAQRGGVDVVSRLPDQLEVLADPVKLGQVIDNLLSNAIKYTPRGGTVTVSLRRVPAGESDEGKDWAEVRIQDTGIGMTDQERADLFTNYYRAEHVRQAAIPGTGLGLAISQGFVRQHGGEITVTSQRGVGSTFTVRIPVDGRGEEHHC